MRGLFTYLVLAVLAYAGAYFYLSGVVAHGDIRRTPQIDPRFSAQLQEQDLQFDLAIRDGGRQLDSVRQISGYLATDRDSFQRMVAETPGALGSNGPVFVSGSTLLFRSSERIMEVQQALLDEAAALRGVNAALTSGAPRDSIIERLNAIEASRHDRAENLRSIEDDLRAAQLGLQVDRSNLTNLAPDALQQLLLHESRLRDALDQARRTDADLSALEARYREITNDVPVFYRLERPVWM